MVLIKLVLFNNALILPSQLTKKGAKQFAPNPSLKTIFLRYRH